MSSDIVTLLQLDKDFTQSRVVVTKEINGCDSSFVISSIIGHQIKIKSPLFLITCHSPLSHYQHVGLKMNYNLKRCIDSQQIAFYHLGEDVVNSFMDNRVVTLQEIFLKIKEKATLMLKKYNSVQIIFDGVSHLFDLKYSLVEVNIFLRDLVFFVRNNSNSYILFQCNVANDDDVTQVMSNLLCHMAHIVLEVGNLSTGLSADISGHLVLKKPGQKFETEYITIMNSKPELYHFKLFDKGVKLFAPGII